MDGIASMAPGGAGDSVPPILAKIRKFLFSSNNRGKKALAAGAILGIILWMRKNKRRKSKKTPRYKGYVQKSRKVSANVDALFFRRLYKLLKIMIPRVRSKEVLFLVMQAFFLFSRTVVSVWVAQLDGYIVKSMVSAKLKDFLRGLTYWVMISIPATYINSMIKWLQSKIALAFRTRLTTYFQKMYLSDNVFYKVGNLDSRIENADQLITQDVTKFCTAISQLFSNLSKPCLDIILFGAQLTNEVGHAGPLSLSSFYWITGGLLRLITPPFGKLIAEEARLEGAFRFCHSRIITNAEEIAFYGGHAIEESILNRSYHSLASHQNDMYKMRIFHGMMEGMVIKYLSSVCGLLICAIPIFWADKFNLPKRSGTSMSSRTETYIRNRRYLIGLADAIGRIMYSYKEVNEMAGYTSRVAEMMDVFNDVRHGKYSKIISKANTAELKTFTGGRVVETKDHIKFVNVPIVSPNGDVLIKSLSFEIHHGMHLMITGPNGCGKSSLFRILGGLWPAMNGLVEKPPNKDLFYVPQRPYLSLGTLRDQVIYPDSVEDMHKKGLTDKDLIEILSITKLMYIVKREGGWDVINDWKDVLSGGEKQRMGMARLFYHKPLYAILDECTSQVSMDVEGIIYTTAKEMKISLMTVSHRPSLWKYHDYILQFDGAGGWKFGPLDVNHRVSLEEEKTSLETVLKDIPKVQRRYNQLCHLLGMSTPAPKKKKTRRPSHQQRLIE